jgi:aminomethyltransferase
VQARTTWAVGWKKERFWGREALLAERESGAVRYLWGLESLDRGIPRAHMPVLVDGAQVGEVTSGTFSPTRKVGIGLALLEPSLGEGAEVEVDVPRPAVADAGRQAAVRAVPRAVTSP